MPRVSRYTTPRHYHVIVNNYYIYNEWLLEPVDFYYTDGYWEIDNYPYYVDNGYRYRYSTVDQCQYDLVDGDSNTVAGRTELMACNEAFDLCAADRDVRNTEVGMDRFFCAESVDPDLRQEGQTTYYPLPQVISEAEQKQIAEFLKGKDVRKIWKAGYRQGVGTCSIVKLRGNEHDCKWMINVKGKHFPDANGGICSAKDRAALIGCEEDGQKNNAGCILKKAVLEGQCF